MPAWAEVTEMPENETQESSAPAQELEAQEIDWKAEARKWEQRAKDANKRVKELEPVEARARELEESSKSELQKALERAEAAEKAALQAQAEKLRIDVAAAKGVPVDLLNGNTRDELEKAADAILAFRDALPRKGNYAPREGHTSTDLVDTEKREFVRNLFANND